MKHLKKALLGLSVAIAVGACTPAQQSTEITPIAAEQKVALKSGIRTQNMDLSVQPGDNFFNYVNGTWLKTTEIPADKASYGNFAILADEAQEHVKAIIDAASQGDYAVGSDQQKVGDMYSSYIDIDNRNKVGIKPLKSEFDKIAKITNYDQLVEYFAYSVKYGYGTPISFFQYADFKSPNDYALYAWQAGIGLPDREYYFKEDEDGTKILAAYQAHIEKMFTLAGIENGAKNAEMLLALETKIAQEHMKKEQARNWAENYDKLSMEELKALMPNFNWDVFVKASGFDMPESMIIMQNDFLTGIDKVIAETSLDDWKSFLQWGVINSSASSLNMEMDKANFDFYSTILYGVEEQRPMWRRATGLLNSTLGEVIGKVYVKQHFPPEAKQRMQVMVDNLISAYEVSIKDLDWMTDETRIQALEKLSKFTVKIGYPDKWKDYSALEVSDTDLFGNLRNAANVTYAEELAKQGKPVDKTEWGMTPQTVNAYYNPTANEIVFPAAILQPPFFDLEADDAANYGGIGAVIGHEIGHGFDDAGSTFDGDGVLRNWWTDTDREEFKTRTAKLVEQYNAFEPLEGIFVNGEFTLGENIGDLGGISIALRAYQMSLNGGASPILDGFTGEQRVFLGFAQVWAGKYRDEALKSQINTDPHSPAQFRANGAVRNVPEFYTAFDVKPTDALYLPEEERVKIW
ncbi:MAG: putative endopeptidase [Bermanella sp.]|jgi:putative endopeptidase|uniref:M13 family metallopeptidase n=1 Tax=Glaciecola sp. 33A TaxID=2057807 RepID=UPI000C34E5ED|nr:M13-type metalloendopeptidase [Glaciecola sp. 33A]PKI02902.1 peptidase M13 [Glaciecola sp. 33A]